MLPMMTHFVKATSNLDSVLVSKSGSAPTTPKQ